MNPTLMKIHPDFFQKNKQYTAWAKRNVLFDVSK